MHFIIHNYEWVHLSAKKNNKLKNKKISEEDLNALFKELFATELFSDISFDFKKKKM